MKKTLFAIGVATLMASNAFADELKFHTYNPQQNSIFPVSSVIVEGDNELLLVDAQFQRNDAENIVNQLKALNKPLKTIFISHGDPDYYFGLDVITQAFPDAQVLTTPETLKHIKKTLISKVEYWSPILEKNAPKALVLPQATDAKTLSVGTSVIEIKGKDIDPEHIYLWQPESKTLFGGVQLYQGMHLWLADSQTKTARQNWIKQLEQMEKLAPTKVIAGHYLGQSTPDAISFDKTYLQTAEKALAKAKKSQDLVKALTKAYPNLAGESDLEMSAKVLTGEMKW